MMAPGVNRPGRAAGARGVNGLTERVGPLLPGPAGSVRSSSVTGGFYLDRAPYSRRAMKRTILFATTIALAVGSLIYAQGGGGPASPAGGAAAPRGGEIGPPS